MLTGDLLKLKEKTEFFCRILVELRKTTILLRFKGRFNLVSKLVTADSNDFSTQKTWQYEFEIEERNYQKDYNRQLNNVREAS